MDFVTEQAQSNMWGAAYRYHSQKITPAEAMNAVTAAGSHGLTWISTAEILMDTLIRPDNPEDDTGEQQVFRQVAEGPPCTGDAGSVDLIDLELVLAKMKSGKAPGFDSINPELIKEGWTHLRPRLVQRLPQTRSLPENMEERSGQVSPQTWGQGEDRPRVL